MKPFRRIAILKPSALGDIVHALPVLSALRQLYPQSQISWVVNAGFEALLTGHPDLNETIPFDRGVFKKGLLESLAYSRQFADRLRQARFDLVIDLQGLLRTGLMCAASGAPVRIGFANAREGSRWTYTRRVTVPDADRIHAIDRYWRIVEALGGAHLEKRFVLPIRDEERQRIRQEFAGFPRPWVSVAVGAKWLTKRWPPANFAQLLKLAQSEFGGTVFLIGASDDIALSAEVASQLTNSVIDLTGKTSLPRLAALFAESDAMLANDTGPLHLAVALGVPCIAPYLCTKVALHGPYPVRRADATPSQNRGIATAVSCAGSYVKRCPHGMICMAELTPDKLWPAFREVLRSCRKS